MSEIAIKALQEIKALKSTPIGDTGFSVGPALLLHRAQRIAREALSAERKALASPALPIEENPR